MPVIYYIYILNTYVPSYFSNETDDIDVFLVFYWRKNDGILENGEENIAALL